MTSTPPPLTPGLAAMRDAARWHGKRRQMLIVPWIASGGESEPLAMSQVNANAKAVLHLPGSHPQSVPRMLCFFGLNKY